MIIYFRLLIKLMMKVGICCLMGSINIVYANDIKPCEAIANKSLPGAARPYIFNHAHIDNGPWWWTDGDANNSQWRPQSVPVNSCLHIQLPGAPTRWFVVALVINGVKASTAELKQSSYPNQNRYIVPCKKTGIPKDQCPTRIDQFELNVLESGTTVITIIGTPPALIPAQLAKIQNGFRSYTLTLKVTE